jgi:hypothetical protein
MRKKKGRTHNILQCRGSPEDKIMNACEEGLSFSRFCFEVVGRVYILDMFRERLL